MSIDAEDDATPALVRQYVRDNGLAGVRFFGGRKPDGSMPWLNSPKALKTWEVAQEFGLVIDLEVLSQGGGGPSIPAIIELARRYPDIRIVLDHLLEPEMLGDGKGGKEHFGLDQRYEALAREKNIYFKFTSINLDICREENIPADRLVRRFLNSAVLLTPEEQRLVFHDTGERVFIKGGINPA